MPNTKDHMKNSSIEVFVNEDFGRAKHRWIPNMTEQEFMAWYKDLTDSDIIKFYFNIKSLPGKITPWPSKSLTLGGSAAPRAYGDPRSFRPYYYMHFHDVQDTFIAVGDDIFRRRPTMKYDWKSHWLDYWMKTQPAEVF